MNLDLKNINKIISFRLVYDLTNCRKHSCIFDLSSTPFCVDSQGTTSSPLLDSFSKHKGCCHELVILCMKLQIQSFLVGNMGF